MNYDEAIQYLENSYKFGKKKDNDNFRKLLNLFDNPQDKLNIIHVAGTNGKGSLCAMLSSILIKCGYKVGIFISPHLIYYNERISINNKYISNDDFAESINSVKNETENLFKNSKDHFSFFEILTAAAFNYFFNKDVDIAIIETGMGGLLDSTNVIKEPLVSVITSIGFDHMEYLGNTIEKITTEKGGIIKKNCPTVLYSQDEKVYNVINNICKYKNSTLFFTNDYGIKIKYYDFFKTVFDAENNFFCFKDISIKMIGQYQVYNACNALMTVEALKTRGFDFDSKVVLEGLKKAYFNGRMELLSKNPFIMLDGAHNIDGANKLSQYLKDIKQNYNKKIILILSIVKDKQYKEVLDEIIKYSDIVILTQSKNKRALSALKLYDVIRDSKKEIYISFNSCSALHKAIKKSNNDFIFCAGSLYLIGEIKSLFY